MKSNNRILLLLINNNKKSILSIFFNTINKYVKFTGVTLGLVAFHILSIEASRRNYNDPIIRQERIDAENSRRFRERCAEDEARVIFLLKNDINHDFSRDNTDIDVEDLRFTIKYTPSATDFLTNNAYSFRDSALRSTYASIFLKFYNKENLNRFISIVDSLLQFDGYNKEADQWKFLTTLLEDAKKESSPDFIYLSEIEHFVDTTKDSLYSDKNVRSCNSALKYIQDFLKPSTITKDMINCLKVASDCVFFNKVCPRPMDYEY